MTKSKYKCNDCGKVASVIDNKIMYCARHYNIKKGYHHGSSADLCKKKQGKAI